MLDLIALALFSLVGAVVSDKGQPPFRAKPEWPFRSPHTTGSGHDVVMVRVFYLDYYKIGKEKRGDELGSLVDYVKGTGVPLWQDYNEGTVEHWIWLPEPGSKNCALGRRRWRELMRDWGGFVDPEFASEYGDRLNIEALRMKGAVRRLSKDDLTALLVRAGEPYPPFTIKGLRETALRRVGEGKISSESVESAEGLGSGFHYLVVLSTIEPLIAVRIPYPLPVPWKDILRALTPVMAEHGAKKKDILAIETLHNVPYPPARGEDEQALALSLDAAFVGGSESLKAFWLYDWRDAIGPFGDTGFVLARKPVT